MVAREGLPTLDELRFSLRDVSRRMRDADRALASCWRDGREVRKAMRGVTNPWGTHPASQAGVAEPMLLWEDAYLRLSVLRHALEARIAALERMDRLRARAVKVGIAWACLCDALRVEAGLLDLVTATAQANAAGRPTDIAHHAKVVLLRDLCDAARKVEALDREAAPLSY